MSVAIFRAQSGIIFIWAHWGSYGDKLGVILIYGFFIESAPLEPVAKPRATHGVVPLDNAYQGAH